MLSNSNSVVLSDGAVRGADFAVGVLLGAVLLGLADLAHACARIPEMPTLPVLGAAWVVSTGALVGVGVPLLLAHRAAWHAMPRKVRLLVAALEGLLLGALALLVEDHPSIRSAYRLAATVAVAGAGAAFALLLERWPRILRVFGAVGGAVLLVWVETLAGRWSRPWLRIVVDIVFMGACGAAWAYWRLKAVSPRTALAAVGSFVVAAPVGVWLVPALRGVVYEYGAHARAPITWASALDIRGTRLGDVDCEDGHRPTAQAPKPSRLSGTAEGADVLFVSFDAMRWDHENAIPEVWRELGARVSFSRAVSPAPRTEHSFGALLRGVPVRQLPNRRAAESFPTIAQVLATHGYRTVQIPTHRYFAARFWHHAGFELVFTSDFTTKPKTIVPAESALKKALEVTRATTKPLLLWVHLMEGHDPYFWRGGQGPPTLEGQRHAFRDLDARVAAFIREFRQIRASRRAVIFVFGDHGEEFGEHGSFFHSTSVYAEQVRSVLALSAPGIANGRVDAPVTLASLPSTVMDLLGLKAAPTFTEPSLLSCIETREQCPGVAVSQMLIFGGWIGYTFERHRLLADPEHDIERLYDSATDPLEQRDLAPSEPALLAKLRERGREFDRKNCVPDASR
jgi:hypothetical protein